MFVTNVPPNLEIYVENCCVQLSYDNDVPSLKYASFVSFDEKSSSYFVSFDENHVHDDNRVNTTFMIKKVSGDWYFAC